MTGPASTSRDSDLVRVLVDDELCVGVGNCAATEPDAFVLGDDGVSSAVPDVLLPRERAQLVCGECPTGAISIVDTCEASEP